MNEEDKKFQNYSNASRLRQSAIPPQVRKARARAAAKLRWAKTTPAERKLHSEKMTKAKQSLRPLNKKISKHGATN